MLGALQGSVHAAISRLAEIRLDTSTAPSLSGVYVSGTKYYASIKPSVEAVRLDAYVLDFAEPVNPVRSPRLAVPARVALAIDDSLYTVAEELYETEQTTVSRVRWTVDGATSVEATRSWPRRVIWPVGHDDAGHLWVVNSMSWIEPEPMDARASWTRLEVLDAPTLETLGVLEIDRSTWYVGHSAGRRLFFHTGGAILVIDARDPRNPVFESAFPADIDSKLVLDGNTRQASTARTNTSRVLVDEIDLVGEHRIFRIQLALQCDAHRVLRIHERQLRRCARHAASTERPSFDC